MAKPPRDSNQFESWYMNLMNFGSVFLESKIVNEIIGISVPKSLEPYLSVEPEMLSCFDYAFCQIEEKRALLTDYPNEKGSQPFRKLGYTLTASPQPEDLVLYLNGNDPMHLGVYKGDGPGPI